MQRLVFRYYNINLLSTSIASAITAAEQLLEDMKSIHVWTITIIHLRARSISERIPTSSTC